MRCYPASRNNHSYASTLSCNRYSELWYRPHDGLHFLHSTIPLSGNGFSCKSVFRLQDSIFLLRSPMHDTLTVLKQLTNCVHPTQRGLLTHSTVMVAMSRMVCRCATLSSMVACLEHALQKLSLPRLDPNPAANDARTCQYGTCSTAFGTYGLFCETVHPETSNGSVRALAQSFSAKLTCHWGAGQTMLVL